MKKNLSKVEVIKYDPLWPKLFQEEADKIKEALGTNCVAVHHIGSTSVPGLAAKPIIDILPVVLNLKDVDAANSNMQQLGYEVKGEHGFMLRRFFVKENAFHVHVFSQGDPEIERHLKFRDWMRNNPDDRSAYASLKEKLAEKYFNDRTSYSFGKDAFVANIDEKAGWQGIRIVKALTENEWRALKEFRNHYFQNKFQKLDPYTSSFSDSNHVHLVVLKKTDIIGYIQIELEPESKASIHFIFIDKKYRRQNFGSKLLLFIVKWLQSRDYKILCSKSLPESDEFFRKHDFKDLQTNNAIKKDDNDIVLIKKI